MSQKAVPFSNYNRDISTMPAPSGFYSLYYSDVPKRARIITHFHYTIELMLVMSGTVSVSVEGVVYPMREGDIAIVQPGRMHRTLIHTPDKLYSRYVLHLDPEFVREMIAQQGLSEAGFDYLFRNGVLTCSRADTLFVSSLLERLHTLEHENRDEAASSWTILFPKGSREEMLRILNNGSYDVPVMKVRGPNGLLPQYAYAKCLLQELLLYFAMHTGNVRQQIVPLTNPLVEKTIQYINEHYREPDLSLGAMAQALFVSQGYLCRMFKKYSGGSVYNYVIQKRLRDAQEYLRGGAGVLDACIQCGFRDYSSFLKEFRAAYGITPREYVAQCRALTPAWRAEDAKTPPAPKKQADGGNDTL